MKFETVDSQTVHKGKVFNLRLDQVRMPDGKQARFDIIDHPPAVTLVPVDTDNTILFIRQYRHAIGGEILELPAGVVEAGEPAELCARREIREETGMSASEILNIGEFYQVPGYSTEYMYVYLAKDLKPDPLPGDEDEYISVERIPVDKAYQMAQNGEIVDAKTLAALLLAAPHLGRRF
jgi:ADP-ribose pyrophosphatase